MGHNEAPGGMRLCPVGESAILVTRTAGISINSTTSIWHGHQTSKMYRHWMRDSTDESAPLERDARHCMIQGLVGLLL